MPCFSYLDQTARAKSCRAGFPLTPTLPPIAAALDRPSSQIQVHWIVGICTEYLPIDEDAPMDLLTTTRHICLTTDRVPCPTLGVTSLCVSRLTIISTSSRSVEMPPLAIAARGTLIADYASCLISAICANVHCE